METNSPKERDAPPRYTWIKPIPEKYTKDYIKDSWAQGKAEYKTKQDFTTFNILRVANMPVEGTNCLEDLYYEADIGNGDLVIFYLEQHRARPMEIHAMTTEGCKQMEGPMMPPEWIMSHAAIVEPSK